MTSDQLKTLRRTLGLSQQALAKHLGVTVSTVAKWEQAVHPIPPLASTLLRTLKPPRR